MFMVMAIVLGGVVVSTPAGAVIDSAVVVPSPNTGANNNSLYSVSCVTASFCVATGHYWNGSAAQTLVEQWNGSVWTVIPSPNTGTDNNILKSVSCVSTSFCVATGYYPTSVYQTLVEQWNGVAWTVIASPNTGTNHNYLESVSCVSTSFCVATGYYWNLQTDQTLVVSLTGPVPPTTTTTTGLSPNPVVPVFTG